MLIFPKFIIQFENTCFYTKMFLLNQNIYSLAHVCIDKWTVGFINHKNFSFYDQQKSLEIFDHLNTFAQNTNKIETNPHIANENLSYTEAMARTFKVY